MPKGQFRKLDLKCGDIRGKWKIISDPVWYGNGTAPTVRVVCLGCNVEYEREAYYFTGKHKQFTGCIACLRRRNGDLTRIVDGKKLCTKCSKIKSIEEFHNDRQRPGGKFTWCKPCANAYTKPIKKRHRANRDSPFLRTSRRWRDKKYFGSITIFDELIEQQGGKCAICDTPHDDRTVPRFAIDHCHERKVIRGVLCQNCNKALGNARDSIEILQRMIEYLRSNANIEITSGEYSL